MEILIHILINLIKINITDGVFKPINFIILPLNYTKKFVFNFNSINLNVLNKIVNIYNPISFFLKTYKAKGCYGVTLVTGGWPI